MCLMMLTAVLFQPNREFIERLSVIKEQLMSLQQKVIKLEHAPDGSVVSEASTDDPAGASELETQRLVHF